MKIVSISLVSLLMSVSAFANTVSIDTGIRFAGDVNAFEASCAVKAHELQAAGRGSVEVSANPIEYFHFVGCSSDCTEPAHNVVESGSCDAKVSANGTLSVTSARFRNLGSEGCSTGLVRLTARTLVQNARYDDAGTCVVDLVNLK